MGIERKKVADKEIDKSVLDEFLGPQEEKIAIQDRFLVQPTFWEKEVIEGKKPKITRSKTIIRKEKEPGSVRTSISEIEVIYPWLLNKTGVIKGSLPEWGYSEKVEEASIAGLALHEADALFNCVFKGVKGNAVRSFFPNQKDIGVAPIINSVREVDLSNESSPSEAQEVFMKAWGLYLDDHDRILQGETQNLVLNDMRFGNIFDRNSIEARSQRVRLYRESEIYEVVELLAQAWAKEVAGKRKSPLTWEFERGAITQREVLLVDNMKETGLQFTGRLDSISRRDDRRKVRCHHIDLKTGRSEFNSPMEQEINLRQSQMMLHMAERFTALYLLEFESLEPRDEAFFVKTYPENLAFVGRIKLAGKRYFDKQTGEMRVEKITMTPAERQDFIRWLKWYGSMIQKYRVEKKALADSRVRFDSRRIALPTDLASVFDVRG